MMNNDVSPLFSKLAIAPMIDWTDTYFRTFMRLIAPTALLYTEMQTPQAIYHQPRRTLYYHPIERPLALQLGGSDPNTLVMAAKAGELAGFSEINLNFGCPSSRVLAGSFGASMMSQPEKAAECLAAIKAAVSIPVTAKTRIGIDHDDSYLFFKNFVNHLVLAGCDKLIVHARKAWLTGLSPKQNRTIPPLNYEYVYQIKSELPQRIPVIINGQVDTQEAVQHHLRYLDGVMIGRLACHNPYAMGQIHQWLYPQWPRLTRTDVFEQYLGYVSNQAVPVKRLLKPVLNLVHGLVGAKAFKQQLLQIQSLSDSATIRALTQQLRDMERSLDGFCDSILVN